jgi:hypothetical protein
VVNAQAARGLVAVGTTQGALHLVDPRADFKAQHSIAAHGAGLSDLDARADLLATCGYALRHGQVAVENYVKVRDGLGFRISGFHYGFSDSALRHGH